MPKISLYGQPDASETNIRRTLILMQAPIFNSFSRMAEHWARAILATASPIILNACSSVQATEEHHNRI